MQLKVLLSSIDLDKTTLKSFKDIDIKGLALDSRQVKPGYLFFAFKGSTQNGRDFIQEAISQGAVFVISEQSFPEINISQVGFLQVETPKKVLSALAKSFYGNYDFNPKCIGVTGTNGKTSVASLLFDIFNSNGFKSGVQTSIQTVVGSWIQDSRLTTPDILEINLLFQKMRENEAEFCFLEASSQGIDQGRLDHVNIETRILTQVSSDHLDYHHTIEKYINTKKSWLQSGQVIIVNVDDSIGKEIAENQSTISYSVQNQDADFYAHSISVDLEQGLYFKVKYLDKIYEIKAPNYFGEFYVENLLAVIACCNYYKLDWSKIQIEIESSRPPKGRLQRLNISNFSVFIDYSHTADSLEKTLKSLRILTSKNLICVFGCGGDRDELKRPEMGKVAEKWSDFFIVTSDNPRFEKPCKIIEDVCSGLKGSTEFEKVVDRKQAIYKALSLARPGDICLVAGKGHEGYQEVKGERFVFSDVDVVQSFLDVKGIE